jgi:hypothetical protein
MNCPGLQAGCSEDIYRALAHLVFGLKPNDIINKFIPALKGRAIQAGQFIS